VESWALAAGILTTAMAGCAASPLTDPAGTDCRDGTCSVTLTYVLTAAVGGQGLDLLVVVDDTPAVAAVAGGIPAKFADYPDLIARLPRNGPPPMHVAFISGTIPSAGCTPPPNRAASCGVAAPDQFLASRCGAQQNFAGAASDTFSCLADYGSTGCGTFQPLEAVHRALADAADGGLAGTSPFFTPGAALAVLVVAGQDDASEKPVSDYLAELTALAPYVFFPLVIGPPDVPRLAEFASGGGMTSLSDPSFDRALAPLRSQLPLDVVVPCLKGIKDMDPSQPGLQASCVTEEDAIYADGTRPSATLPVCDATSSVQPCLWLAADPTREGCWVPQIKRPPDSVDPCGPESRSDVISCVACANSTDPGCSAL
jgi:hypothetical protein